MRVYIAGHRGMVGKALIRRLSKSPYVDEVVAPEGRGPDLRVASQVEGVLRDLRPDAVVLAAARVGGIGANSSLPVEFMLDNMLIGMNVVSAAHCAGIGRLVNLGSSCIYPRAAQQPLRPEALLTGELEPTNEAYALAKIATLRLCQYYRREYGRRYVSVMPTNLYGPEDRYSLDASHVLPTLIMKFEAARINGGPVTLWGTGTPFREFLHVDDLADAVAVALRDYDDDAPINVGSGVEVTIMQLAELVSELTGYRGPIEWDESKPDGMPRKILDSSKIRELGWSPKITLREGVEKTIQEYRAIQSRRSNGMVR